jgi:hypothetical protein
MKDQLTTDGGGAVSDAAGGLVDVLAADAAGVALGAVPAAQDPSGADAGVRCDLAYGKDRAEAQTSGID